MNFFPELAALPERVKEALKFYGLKENPQGMPSQCMATSWAGRICLMVLVGGSGDQASGFYPTLIHTVLEDARPGMKSQGIFAAGKR